MKSKQCKSLAGDLDRTRCQVDTMEPGPRACKTLMVSAQSKSDLKYPLLTALLVEPGKLRNLRFKPVSGFGLFLKTGKIF